MYKKIILTLFTAWQFVSCAQTNQKTGAANHSESVKTTTSTVVLDTTWTEKVIKTNAEWKKILTAEQYHITREQGTERPFTSEFYDLHDEGTFTCLCCDNPLFASATKFESGTGWPSFFAPYSSKSLGYENDVSHGMVRSEIHCLRCDAHLGHVFDDGPKPTGLRHCIDGLALKFVPKKSLAVATFAGGCFWCEETIFESIKGVNEVISGYSGGKEKNPSYKSVGAGETGHAEAFEVYYDPAVVSYADLVRVYFASIDPTQVNGQGPDIGKQYRSIAFFRNSEEQKTINDYIAKLSLSKTYDKAIAVEAKPYDFFMEAEARHQNYVRLHPEDSYVLQESLPRRAKTLKQVQELIK